MKTLVIAEKPDMGRNIAAVLEPKAANKRTHIEGERYVITWAIGHLIGLAEPDHYDDRYKRWNLGDLPIIPDTFKLLPNVKTKDQLKVIAQVAKDCDRIVNACDAGREGQLIFSYIQQHLKLRQPVQRLWISDLTAETIRRGFAELKDGSEYENLTQAARARSEADWLIGMNGSRAFTTRHNELLSVGRVQTPVLALIYDRQKQIEAFDSEKFFEVEGSFQQGETGYRGMWQGDRFKAKDKAEAVVARVKGKPGRIASYEVKETKEFPFKLYDLTLLQREANGKLGFSAKKTLDTAQALYEKHKVISYPRTNSNYVNPENIPDMHKTLESLKGSADYGSFAQGADKKLVHKNNKFVCNPAKVEDHHAILPTFKKASGLSPDEAKIYDLIVRRFLSHFYPAAEYKVHTVFTEVGEGETVDRFKTTVKELLSLGWKVLYPDQKKGAAAKGGGKGKAGKSGDGEGAGPEKDGDKDENNGPSELEVEMDTPFHVDPQTGVLCADAEVKEKETQPPKPFTEGTLLKAMESAGKTIEDDELRDVMKDSGLGTPATRAATIERLKQVGYVAMQGKRISITPKGRAAVELVRGAGVELLASPEMTGQWERRLNEIARGQASKDAFMEKVRAFARLIVDKVRLQARADKAHFAKPEPAAGGGKGSKRGGAAKSAGAGQAAAGAEGAAPARKRRSAKAEASPGAGEVSGSGRTAATVEAAGGTPAAGSGAGAAAGRTAAKAGTAAPPVSPSRPAMREALGHCPRPGCGGRIIFGSTGYGCTHFRQGCTFVLWKDTGLGVTLNDTMVTSLLRSGQTSFYSETAGSGTLILQDPQTGKLSLLRN
ncbi:DNA topoisomerase 3 [Paenibacillus sp. YN15]|uniref:DNA topoisomerase 3 n=1 Tax=Paenibacillus sp. YN15 TaxID=1742774 RepID=UPI000DCCBAFD|nr:DNA topoisomerase 3 [Paenibacillus sp. YN15]RAU97160.1 DNA topoisomerase III [Paenibacillus sp. YN15]